MAFLQRLANPPVRIRYCRKSSEAEDRQIASIERQHEEMDAKFGPLSEAERSFCFEDEKSGKSWDRPKFQEMERFCRLNPRPKSDPGFIEVYNVSRFGRILKADGTEDVEAVALKMREFEELGWQVRFAKLEPTGNTLFDKILLLMESHAASKYIRDLSQESKNGREKLVRDHGRWSGGRAPFGTVRLHPHLKDEQGNPKILQNGERAPNGGSILAPHEQELKWWHRMADMLLARKSYADIVAMLEANGVTTSFNARWSHTGVQIVLSNKALIGIIEYRKHLRGEEVKEFKACWEPMVPIDKFEAVQREIQRRKKAQGKTGRKKNVQTLLDVLCAACKMPYYGLQTVTNKGTRSEKETRYYVHPVSSMRYSQEKTERIEAAGCKHWYVNADELEDKVFELLIEQRGSVDFAKDLKKALMAQGDLESQAKERIEHLEDRLRQLKRRESAITEARIEARIEGLDTSLFLEKLKEVQEQIATLTEEKNAAIDRLKVTEQSRQDINSLVKEATSIGHIWECGDFEERRRIVETWVHRVFIQVERTGKRGAKRTALVSLRVAPKTVIPLKLDNRIRKAALKRAQESKRGEVKELEEDVIIIGSDTMGTSGVCSHDGASPAGVVGISISLKQRTSRPNNYLNFSGRG